MKEPCDIEVRYITRDTVLVDRYTAESCRITSDGIGHALLDLTEGFDESGDPVRHLHYTDASRIIVRPKAS